MRVSVLLQAGGAVEIVAEVGGAETREPAPTSVLADILGLAVRRRAERILQPSQHNILAETLPATSLNTPEFIRTFQYLRPFIKLRYGLSLRRI